MLQSNCHIQYVQLDLEFIMICNVPVIDDSSSRERRWYEWSHAPQAEASQSESQACITWQEQASRLITTQTKRVVSISLRMFPQCISVWDLVCLFVCLFVFFWGEAHSLFKYILHRIVLSFAYSAWNFLFSIRVGGYQLILNKYFEDPPPPPPPQKKKKKKKAKQSKKKKKKN